MVGNRGGGEPPETTGAFRLAKPGRIVGFDINTAHFTGNYPPGASIDGSSSEGVPSDDDWQELLEPVPDR